MDRYLKVLGTHASKKGGDEGDDVNEEEATGESKDDSVDDKE